MEHEARPVLGYGTAAYARPRHAWAPVAALALACGVWHLPPRLTPTGFPNAIDLAVLAALAPATFAMAWWSSLPPWVFTAFGAEAVALFLLANLHDNNFRANVTLADVALPWSGMVGAGGLAGAAIARGARAVTRYRWQSAAPSIKPGG